jgi:hypothetical protein
MHDNFVHSLSYPSPQKNIRNSKTIFVEGPFSCRGGACLPVCMGVCMPARYTAAILLLILLLYYQPLPYHCYTTAQHILFTWPWPWPACLSWCGPWLPWLQGWVAGPPPPWRWAATASLVAMPEARCHRFESYWSRMRMVGPGSLVCGPGSWALLASLCLELNGLGCSWHPDLYCRALYGPACSTDTLPGVYNLTS